jgi:MFS family permease
VVDRIGKGMRTPPRDALIAEITAPAVRGRAFGFHRAADHFGAVLGSVAAWLLLSQGAEVRSVIAWSVVPGIAAFVVLAGVLRGRTGGPAVGQADGRTAGQEPPTDRPPVHPSARFWPSILALAALTLFRLPEALLILRLQDGGVAVAAIPLIWAGLHVVRSASSYPGGWLSDRLGPRRVVAAGGLLFGVIAGVFGIPLTPSQAALLFLALGLVAGLTESGERAVVARLAPLRMGRGFGSYHALVGATALPGGLLFGWLYQWAGGRTALWASAAGMTLAVSVWLSVSPADEAADL